MDAKITHIENLIRQAYQVPFRDRGHLEEFCAGVRKTILELFGENSQYYADMDLIRFAPASFYSSAAEYAAKWSEGINAIVHLLNRMLEDPTVGGKAVKLEELAHSHHKNSEVQEPTDKPDLIADSPEGEENGQESYERMEQAIDSLLDRSTIEQIYEEEKNQHEVEEEQPKDPADPSINVDKSKPKNNDGPKVSKVGEFTDSLLSIFKVKHGNNDSTPQEGKQHSANQNIDGSQIDNKPKAQPDKIEKSKVKNFPDPKSESEIEPKIQLESKKVDDNLESFRPTSTQLANQIFVLHDTEIEIKNNIVDKLTKLGLQPVVLHSREHISKSLTQKLTEFTNVKFAVVVLSAAEMTYPKHLNPNEATMQSTQNLVFELGFWVGQLGRERVFVLYPDNRNFVRPTEYFDVYYQLYDKHGNWFMELIQRLKKCGFKLNL